MKKLALPLLLCSTSAFAIPFNATDTRAMAMGDTGVASSKPGSTPLFNAALLSQYGDHLDHDASIILPNIGVGAAGDQDALDAFQNIDDDDYLGTIETSINAFNQQAVASTPAAKDAARSISQATQDLNTELGNLSGQPITINAGALVSVAIPNKKFGFAVYANSQAVIETSPTISECDQTMFDKYADVAQDIADNPAPPVADQFSNCNDGNGNRKIYDAANNDFIDPVAANYMTSDISVAGVTINEFGIAMARQFNIAGHDISFGITPKMMEVTSYYARPTIQQLDNDDTYDLGDDLEASEKTDSAFNIDLSMATTFFDDKVTLGATVKNIIGKSYKTKADTNGDSTSFDIDPQARVGVAWDLPLGFTLASDLDLTKNKAFFNGQDSRYLGLGAEWDIFSALRLRAGMRSNLEDSDDTALTAGLGFNIFVVHLDLGAQFSDNNAAAGLQLGVEF